MFEHFLTPLPYNRILCVPEASVKAAKFSRKFCKDRNLFIITAPIRRRVYKKLHKVLHIFLLRTFSVRKILETVQILQTEVLSRFDEIKSMEGLIL